MMGRPPFGFVNEPGWVGSFTRHQAEGAIANGTAIIKVASEDGDMNANGVTGTVLGSIDASKLDRKLAEKHKMKIGYWVEWDHKPKHAIFIVDWKIASMTKQ